MLLKVKINYILNELTISINSNFFTITISLEKRTKYYCFKPSNIKKQNVFQQNFI